MFNIFVMKILIITILQATMTMVMTLPALIDGRVSPPAARVTLAGVTPSTPDTLDEWHMDFVPTGYLPDSVYRELAWYGILQVQPLYRSTKHKVAAQWIWQNTLGRPFVVLENQPQSTQSEGTANHESISEDSAKWSRERRLAQDVLMENIRSGGNGITVRTVMSATNKTVYIIQSGKYYSCVGSEPDMDAFRVQANIHERKCTSGQPAVAVPLLVDPCMDAEMAPLEYSYNKEWIFCLGEGERDSTHTPNGEVDCGKKIKISFSDFLRDCAIDNNVVISYEYFGDEPRKDLVHNTTLCTSWDPCRVSYLYRIEAPDYVPQFPATTPDPCDTTICPECVEGFTEQYFDPDIPNVDDSNGGIKSDSHEDVEWVSTSIKTFEKIQKRAMLGGHLATGERVYIIRSLSPQNNLVPGYYVENATTARITCCSYASSTVTKFDVAVAKAELEWKPPGACPESRAVNGGKDILGLSYVCQISFGGNQLTGTYHFDLRELLTVRDLYGLCVSWSPYKDVLLSRNDYKLLCRV